MTRLTAMVVLMGVMLAQGCGPPMTAREQWLFGGMIAAQAIDGWTEDRLHTLLGERSDAEAIALFKIGTVLTLWGMGEIWPTHREAFFAAGIISGGAATGRNIYLVDKRIKELDSERREFRAKMEWLLDGKNYPYGQTYPYA